MTCIVGPITLPSDGYYLQLAIRLQQQGEAEQHFAFVLDGSGKCFVDIARLRIYVTRLPPVTPGRRSDLDTPWLRALLAALGDAPVPARRKNGRISTWRGGCRDERHRWAMECFDA